MTNQNQLKSSRVRIGIVGCANIAERYMISAIKRVPSAELVCIASRDKKKAIEWSQRHGIQAEESYESLLVRKDIDAVYIPLPPGLHHDWVVRAANAKKHILCEKSLSTSLASVKDMITSCKNNKVLLFENFMCGYHPQQEKVISLVKANTIGDPFIFNSQYGFPHLDKNSFRYNSSLGGSCLYETGSYPVFMSRKIFAVEPRAVTCTLTIDRKTDIDTEGSGLLEFP